VIKNFSKKYNWKVEIFHSKFKLRIMIESEYSMVTERLKEHIDILVWNVLNYFFLAIEIKFQYTFCIMDLLVNFNSEMFE